MSTSPVDDFLAWYASLPVSHRQDIAALVANATPGFQGLDIWSARDLPSEFVATIQGLRNGRYREVGLALALRTSMEFFIISRRSTRDASHQTKEQLCMAAELGASQAVASELTSLDFRAEQWIRTCEKWQALRQSSLSDDSLNFYLSPG